MRNVDKTPDFMLEEYKQIANAYQDLHAQHNELVRTYLTLVALPAAALAALAQFVSAQPILEQPKSGGLVSLEMPVLIGLGAALSFAGLLVYAALVTTRSEALLYVRTVNRVRRFFVEHDSERMLEKYLVLPDRDNFPPFREGWGARSTYNGLVVAVLNGFILLSTVASTMWFFGARADWGIVENGQHILVAVGVGVLAIVLQVYWRRRLLDNAENTFKVNFASPYGTHRRIGVDLDGVLGDLGGAVIDVARARFGVTIRPSQITTHDLTKCTDLTDSQVREIFEAGDVFRDMEPTPGSVEAVNQLWLRGWEVHIITDRRWGPGSWSTAESWLRSHSIKWDHLNIVSAQEKTNYSKSHGISYFVEDNLETATQLSQVCARVFLLDRTYNQGAVPDNLVRTEDWKHITRDLASRLALEN